MHVLILPNISGIITQANNQHFKALSFGVKSHTTFYFILGFTVSINSNSKAMRNYTRKFFYSRPKQGYRLGYNRYASGSKGTIAPSGIRTKSTGVTRRTDLEHTHIQTWTPDPAGDRIFSPVSLQPNIRGGFSLCKFPVHDSFKLH